MNGAKDKPISLKLHPDSVASPKIQTLVIALGEIDQEHRIKVLRAVMGYFNIEGYLFSNETREAKGVTDKTRIKKGDNE